jgi:hypothetical protein
MDASHSLGPSRGYDQSPALHVARAMFRADISILIRFLIFHHIVALF